MIYQEQDQILSHNRKQRTYLRSKLRLILYHLSLLPAPQEPKGRSIMRDKLDGIVLSLSEQDFLLLFPQTVNVGGLWVHNR